MPWSRSRLCADPVREQRAGDLVGRRAGIYFVGVHQRLPKFACVYHRPPAPRLVPD
jgi:hypothetical protein